MRNNAKSGFCSKVYLWLVVLVTLLLLYFKILLKNGILLEIRILNRNAEWAYAIFILSYAGLSQAMYAKAALWTWNRVYFIRESFIYNGS